MISKLQQFYFENETRAFKWGVWDCSTMANSWVEFVVKEKFNIPVCNSARDYINIDVMPVLDSLMDKIEKPNTGDIVVFNNASNLKQVGIKMQSNILSMTKYGMTVVSFPVISSWRLPCPQR